MTTRAKANRAQNRSIQLLEAAGYLCCRSAASLWDVIAIGTVDIALVMVKIKDWPEPLETSILQDFPAPPNTRKLIHRWKDRRRFPDVREL